MILIIDNYDSFTYNLYQFAGEFNPDIKVVRNDKITLEEIEALAPSHLIFSPGPKYPKDAGILVEAICYFTGKIPILGVCLGHQALGEVFGGKVVKAHTILHGKTNEISIDTNCPLFKDLPKRITVGRYHSLIVQRSSLTEELVIIAEDDQGEIMGLRHKEHLSFGIQFHPESILTPEGKKIIKNFLEV
ncbi:aminodeoxychorismate/anthranilate synthase component II [Sporanaerobium hydrogeniformans]|uniref:Aminodeoxychorismate/anthranilate synthase component II n=1 Tax=Sporanaerobium hydrogeniformans TaxID=3072179 RepID=A0AC61DA46_9FIRM|nr:aminodeoxychorismate/anthranilate synthase component II [Sporanaerobium hydrogeniformans]PHV70224.1 aminodeoxychorismate/anthranilate synthase component II [Sporanaerobium hydrogeniformans]